MHVREIVSEAADRHRVVTSEGEIVARAMVVATNAFTAPLLPELSAIHARQRQVMVTEDAPDRAHGRVVTCEDGPVFFNQPRAAARRGRAPLLLGGGWTTAAGMAAAQMALTGEVPAWPPADVFSPRRLLSAEPVFMNEREGLWRIATALCHERRREVLRRRARGGGREHRRARATAPAGAPRAGRGVRAGAPG